MASGAIRAGAVALALVSAASVMGLLGGDEEPSQGDSEVPGPGSAVSTPDRAPAEPGDSAETGASSEQPASPRRILFDAAHGQQAGNADWVISTSMPDPLGEDPQPEEEGDWTGALSTWGVALAGYPDLYRIASNPPGRPLTYGQAGNGLDLAKVELLVLPEPNRSLTEAERRAVVAFVSAGGGLFLIVDHADSDRDGDGIDSVGVGAQLLDAFAAQGLATGLEIDEDDIDYENTSNLAAGAAGHPVVDGVWGAGESSILRGGTTVTLDPAANPRAACLLYRDGVDPSGSTGCFLALSEVGGSDDGSDAGAGAGRILLWGDSSPVDDGTGASGDRLYPNFSDPRDTNEAWALNGTDWLAGLS